MQGTGFFLHSETSHLNSYIFVLNALCQPLALSNGKKWIKMWSSGIFVFKSWKSTPNLISLLLLSICLFIFLQRIWKSIGFYSSCGDNSDGFLSLAFYYKSLESMFYMFILVLCLLGCLCPELFPMGTVELLKIKNHLCQESWCTCGILPRLTETVVKWPLFHRCRKVSCLKQEKKPTSFTCFAHCLCTIVSDFPLKGVLLKFLVNEKDQRDMEGICY